MDIIFTSEVLTIEFDNQTSLMVLTWRGKTHIELFKRSIDHYSICINKYKPALLLIDVRDHAGTSPEGQAYAAEATQSYSTNNNIRLRQALLLSEDFFSTVAVKGYGAKLNSMNTVITRSFKLKRKH